MARTGIALGSNLGDRAAIIRAALDGLRGIATPGEPILTAPLYESDPVGCPDGSPAFLNTVVEIDWPGRPLDLLAATRALEAGLGRVANPVRNAPRLIDIDILYCGELALDHPDLVLPHPRLAERLFVLLPLADIRPEFRTTPESPAVSCLRHHMMTGEAPPVRVDHACWPAIAPTSHG